MADRIYDTNEELVSGLKARRVLQNPKIMAAMRKIPRSDFAPPTQRDEASNDKPIRIQSLGFNISAPHMYAACLEQLDPQPGMSFLDIGW